MTARFDIIAHDPDNGKVVQTPAAPYAPFPAIVLFYRTEEQSNREYGTKENNNYDCTFGFDTYIPHIMGAGGTILSNYKENLSIQVDYYVERSDGTCEEIKLYPLANEQPAISPLPAAYEPNYKVPILHIPSDTTSIPLFVKICMPNSADINQKYNDFKAHKGETDEMIHFKVVQTYDSGFPMWDDDGLHYKAYPDSPLTITETVPHTITDETSTHSITITKINVDVISNSDIAIVAFYVNQENSAAKGREMIIGQLNVIPTAVYRVQTTANTNETRTLNLLSQIGADIMPSTCEIVLDLHLVRIAKDVNDVAPTNLISADDVLQGVNRIFKQIGIQFRMRGNGYTHIIMTDADLSQPVKTYTLTNTLTDTAGGTWTVPDLSSKFPGKTSIRYVDGQLGMSSFMNKYMEHKLDNLSGASLDAYNELLKHHSFLDSALSKLTPEQLRDKQIEVFGYFYSRMFTVFIFDQLDTANPSMGTLPDGTTKYLGGCELGYAFPQRNEVVLFSAAINDIVNTLSHELGHCLGINHHTFDSYAMYLLYHTDIHGRKRVMEQLTIM